MKNLFLINSYLNILLVIAYLFFINFLPLDI